MHPARLVRRRHGVDRVAIRRDGAVVDEFRLAFQRRLRRIRRQRQAHALRAVFQHRDLALGRGVLGVEVFRHAAADQELVVQVGTAEGRHEEVVAQRVLAGDLPQAQVLARLAVVAHHQPTAVAIRHEGIVLAAVDLHLVVIEGVHQVARDQAFRQRLAGSIKQLERRIRQMLDVVFLDQVILAADVLARRHHAAPDLRQFAQDRPVAVALRRGRRRHRGQRLGQAREVGEQVVEAAVFQVDHDHVLDVRLELGVQRARRRLACLGRRGCLGGRQLGAEADRGSGLEDAAACRAGRPVGLLGRVLVVILHGMAPEDGGAAPQRDDYRCILP